MLGYMYNHDTLERTGSWTAVVPGLWLCFDESYNDRGPPVRPALPSDTLWGLLIKSHQNTIKPELPLSVCSQFITGINFQFNLSTFSVWLRRTGTFNR